MVLLQGGKVGETAAGTSVTYSAAVPAQYGMSPDDLKVMCFDGAAEVGRGLVDLVTSLGELGESTLLLGSRYPVVLTIFPLLKWAATSGKSADCKAQQ